MTYSIIARDPETGQLGAAAQTFNLAVGTWVPWATGGVGAVATQATAERRYGTMGLELMGRGIPAGEVLQRLLAADPKREERQVSMIDSAGRIATHTGACCLPAAGSYVGDNFCVQANMMARDTVWPAMAAAYRGSDGPLADRLLAALDAAQAEGGDLRGEQTAALLVVSGDPDPISLVDLRVDHDPDPLSQLRRLVQLHRAYTLEYEIVACAERGETERIYEMVAQVRELAPDETYLQCLCALHLERFLGLRAEALAILTPLAAAQPEWRTYLEREYQSARRGGCTELDPQLLYALDEVLVSNREVSA